MHGHSHGSTAWRMPAAALVLLTVGCHSGVSTIQRLPDAAAANSASPNAPDTSQRAFKARLVGLWDEGQYTQLDAIAAQLRTERLRFRGGEWQLHVFYVTLSFPGSATATDAEWQAHLEKLKNWVEYSPASPTPRAALAEGYLRFAWKARGNGYASTVTPAAWQLFKQRVQLARSVLDDAARQGIHDPQTYRQMQTVALAQEWHREQMDALTNEAMAYEPGYFYFALAEANYLLPKWYGQRGDAEKYAGEVADRLGQTQGAAVYFRIAAALNCCKQIQAPAMSWPRIQEGFAQIEQLYGATNRQRNVMAYLALGARDAAAARALFERIGDDWDVSVWKTKARYEAARKGIAPDVESTQINGEDQEI